MTAPRSRVIYVIVCAAGPASGVGTLVDRAQRRGFDVFLVATPNAVGFLDVPELAARSGHPVRSTYRDRSAGRDEGRLPPADVVAVAPATYNTINKWAHGTSDNYALGLLADTYGLGIPVIVLPFVNSALAANGVFQRSVAELRGVGVRVLLGPGGWFPHEPGSGAAVVRRFPWHRVVEEAEKVLMPGRRRNGRPLTD